MGRRKIEIKPIAHERNRAVTFVKRKHGLFKKAYELGVLCSVDVAVIIFEERPGHRPKLYQYCSSKAEDIVQRHLRHDGEKESRGPADYVQTCGKKYEDVEIDDFDYAPARTIAYPYQSPVASTNHRQGQYLGYYPHQRQRERHYYQEGGSQSQQSPVSYAHSVSQSQDYTDVYHSHRGSGQYQSQNSQYARVAQPISYPPQSFSPLQGREYSQIPRAKVINSVNGNVGNHGAPREDPRSTDNADHSGDRGFGGFPFPVATNDVRGRGVVAGRTGFDWPLPKAEFAQNGQQQGIASELSAGRVIERERPSGSIGSPPVERTSVPGQGVHWLDFLAGASKCNNTDRDPATVTRGTSVASVPHGSVSWERGSSSESSSGRDETMAVDGLSLFDLQGG